MYKLSVIAAAAALLLASPALAPDFAAAQAKSGLKVCKSKTPAGKLKTWRCKSDQPCCVSKEMNIYVCGSPMIGCL